MTARKRHAADDRRVVSRRAVSGRSRAAFGAALVCLLLGATLIGSTGAVVGVVSPVAGSAGGPAGPQEGPNASDDSADDIVIESVKYDGLAVVRYDGDNVFLFDDEPHRVEVTVRLEPSVRTVEACAEPRPVDNEEEAQPRESRELRTCERVETTATDAVETVSIELEEWPGNWTGEADVDVWAVSEPGQPDVAMDRATVSVVVLEKDDDYSGSGLTNAEELAHGTDFDRSDTDGDGLQDGEEVRDFGTDPLDRDTGGNGIPDGVEVLLGTDPTDPWTPPAYLLSLALAMGVIFTAIAFQLTTDGEPAAADSSAAGATRSPSERPRTPGGAPQAVGTASGVGRESSPERAVSDERVVRELLLENGGRMKQQDVIEATNWSKSKVSRLLSRMTEAGDIEKVRIGRENIITLTDGSTDRDNGDDA